MYAPTLERVGAVCGRVGGFLGRTCVFSPNVTRLRAPGDIDARKFEFLEGDFAADDGIIGDRIGERAGERVIPTGECL